MPSDLSYVADAFTKPPKRPFSTLVRIATVIPLRRTYVALVCLVFAGAAEGLGVASLLPLVTMIGPDAKTPPKGASAKIAQFVEGFGLEPSLGLFLSVFVAVILIKATLTLIATHQVGRAVADVANNMRVQLIDALLAARWSYYVRQPVGRFSAALSAEATYAGEAYMAAARFSAEVIQVVVYVVVVAIISWKLALVALGIGLFMVLTLNRFVTVAKKTAQKQRRNVKAMVGGLTDLLIGIKPMKAMGRHARFQVLFEKDAEKIRRAQRKQSVAREANKALQEPILAICLAGGLYFAIGVWTMPPGQVLVMALLLARTVSAIGKAQQDLQSMRISQAGFLAIANAIDLARSMREPRYVGPVPTFEKGAEFRDVHFGFDEIDVIRGASFSVPKGKVTTLTGVSGSGKTTLVDLLLGLHEVRSGQILIDDVPITGVDLIGWRKMTGYVPQELMLFHDTLKSNVTLGQPEHTDEDVDRALRQAGASGFVAELPEGLDTVVGERGTRLSGGQRQRIAIARALLHQPTLLILDEATTALDPDTEAGIVANMVELARTSGLTVLAISHQPAWARASDNVVHLSQGRIVKIEKRADEPPADHAHDARRPAEHLA